MAFTFQTTGMTQQKQQNKQFHALLANLRCTLKLTLSSCLPVLSFLPENKNIVHNNCAEKKYKIKNRKKSTTKN